MLKSENILYEEVFLALNKAKIDYVVCGGLAKEKNMKVVSFFNLKDSLKVIDIGVNLPKISEILRNKKRIKINGFTVPIILIDDLIKMKKAVSRPQDLIDVKNLEKIKKERSY